MIFHVIVFLVIILNAYVEKYDFDFQIKKMSPYHIRLSLVHAVVFMDAIK